jgi:hypothetical protein
MSYRDANCAIFSRRSFKGWAVNSICCYRSNKKAWMKSDIFTEWLRATNQVFASKNEEILMTMDNASSHK